MKSAISTPCLIDCSNFNKDPSPRSVINSKNWVYWLHIHRNIENIYLRNYLTDETLYNVYSGFDPTAPDLHIGHLAILSVLKLYYDRGHTVFLLVGDTTARIGDPSFRSTLRTSIKDVTTISNTFEDNLSSTFQKIINKESKDCCRFSILRNSEWHSRVSTIHFLEKIASYVKIADLLKRDSIKDRLNNGMSYAEFTYPLLQAYDFLHLFEKHNCRLQIGGSDQWGNITSGTEIINSIYGKESALGMTISLLSSKDGKKMGKSSGNAIWLTGPRASPISLYQVRFSSLNNLQGFEKNGF